MLEEAGVLPNEYDGRDGKCGMVNGWGVAEAAAAWSVTLRVTGDYV